MKTALFALALLTVPALSGAQGTPPPWLDVQAFTLAAKYRSAETSTGVRTANSILEQVSVRARVKADREGRVALHAGVFTGGSMIAGWAFTGIGLGDPAMQLRVKQLFVAARPMKDVEAQFGGLYFARGESTEVTTYDNDAYLTGERLAVKHRFGLDEISVTHGYAGAVDPSVFQRTELFHESNYKQVLLTRTVRAVAMSADWTRSLTGTTWRAAAYLKMMRVPVAARVETYWREEGRQFGAAVTVERKVARHTLLSGGYASIDQGFGGFNADRFNRGQRLFGMVSTPIYGPVTAIVFYGHAVGNDLPVPIRHRLDAIVSWNALATLKNRS